jgi:hypothetical protein
MNLPRTSEQRPDVNPHLTFLPTQWLAGPRRTSKHRSDQRPHLSCKPPQWLAVPAPTKRTEARAAPSPVVPSNTDAGRAHADQANRGQGSDLTSSARHYSGWMNLPRTSEQKPDVNLHLTSLPTQWLARPTRTSEHRPDQRPHLSCKPPQWLAVPAPTKRTEARAAISTSVPATTVATQTCLAVAVRERQTAIVACGADASCTHRCRDNLITV